MQFFGGPSSAHVRGLWHKLASRSCGPGPLFSPGQLSAFSCLVGADLRSVRKVISHLRCRLSLLSPENKENTCKWNFLNSKARSPRAPGATPMPFLRSSGESGCRQEAQVDLAHPPRWDPNPQWRSPQPPLGLGVWGRPC